MQGIRSQPADSDLNKMIKRVRKGETWQSVFPGISSLKIDEQGKGIKLSLHLTKKKGEAVHLVSEGTPGATVVAIKRVNELDYYSLNITQLADKIELTVPKTTALINKFKLRASDDYFKEIKVGKSKFKRYSVKALDKLKKEIPSLDIEKEWKRYRAMVSY